MRVRVRDRVRVSNLNSSPNPNPNQPKKEGGEADFVVQDAAKTVKVAWPKTPRDYSAEMCLAKGCEA